MLNAYLSKLHIPSFCKDVIKVPNILARSLHRAIKSHLAFLIGKVHLKEKKKNRLMQLAKQITSKPRKRLIL